MDLPPIERDRIGQQIAASLVAALVLTGALAAVVGGATAQSSGPAIVLEANEDATTVDLTLTEAPNGLSGYEITLEVTGDSEANITGASYGDEFGLTESPSIENGNEIRLKASDVGKNVQSGATDVHLATVELEGTQKNTELLTATSLTVDDDDGGKVNPSVRWASQSNEESASNDDNEESSNNNQQSNDDDSSDDSDSNDPSSGGASSDESGGSDDATDSSTTEASTDDDTEESGDDSETTESAGSTGSADATDAPSTESDGTETSSSDVSDEQSTTAGSGDGFGILPAVVGLLSLALYVRRIR